MFLATGVHRCFFIFSITSLLSFSGCIGGGGGGGSQVHFGGANSEYTAQSGLSQVAASAALGAGYTGQNIRIGVVDSGVDAGHSEFRGRCR